MLPLTRSYLWALLGILLVQAVTAFAVLRLGRREAFLQRALPLFVSGAAGVLLATALLDLLPDADYLIGRGPLLWTVLLGTLLALFCLQALGSVLASRSDPSPQTEGSDRMQAVQQAVAGHWHAHSHPGPRSQSRSSSLLLGSALHSAVDGIAITAAFLVSPRAGAMAALAVGLHELPHRVGDFALLLHAGLAKRRAFALAVLAGASALMGWLLVVIFGHQTNSVRWFLPVSAGSFLYIALVDLFPELHEAKHPGLIVRQVFCLLLGVMLAAALAQLPGA